MELYYRSLAAYAMDSLGEVHAAQGDVAGARKLEEKALVVRQAVRENVPMAETQVDLAELSLEEGSWPAELESSLRCTIDVFRSEKNVNDELKAQALLARVLLSQRKSTDATAVIERAKFVIAEGGSKL
jgi:hypothetical protein